MLTLIPTQIISHIALDPFYSSYMSVDGEADFGLYEIPRLILTRGKRPYEFSWKPPKSKKDYCGNRATDHYQLHGILSDRDGIARVRNNAMCFTFAPKRTWTHLIWPGRRFFEDYTTTSGGIPTYRRIGAWGAGGWNNVIHLDVYKTYKGYWPRVYYWSAHCQVIAWRFKNSTSYESSGVTLAKNGWYEIPIETSDPRQVAWELVLSQLPIQPSKADLRETVLGPNSKYQEDWGLKSSTLSRLRSVFIDWAKEVEPPLDPYLLGEATQKAADSAKYFQGNTAMYLTELLKLKESLLDLKQLMKGDVTLKSLSSLYLQGKYGLTLTFQDTLELGKGLARYFAQDHTPKLFSVCRGRETSAGTGQLAGCKLYYDPNTANGFAKVVKGLMDWDLFPTLVNVWDVIPYSFVVDWFAGVEGFLAAHDSHTYLSVLNVFRALYTYKKEWKAWFPGSSLLSSGEITITRFKRWSQPEVIEPTPHFTGSVPSDHIPEGTALIIQALK